METHAQCCEFMTRDETRNEGGGVMQVKIRNAPSGTLLNLKSRERMRLGFTLLELGLVLLVLGILVALLLPSTRRTAGDARRSACKNNLKTIGLALHNYRAEEGEFPPNYTVDAEGQPLHSWRVLLLPYLENKGLYDRIDLTKPWDAEENRDLLAQRPYVFACPNSDISDQHTTYHLIKLDLGYEQSPEEDSEIADSSFRYLVMEVDEDQSVPWMAPQDVHLHWALHFDSQARFSHRGGTHIGLADGSVQFLSQNVPRELLEKIYRGEHTE